MFSDIVNGRKDDIPIQIAQGISLAKKYGIDLKPGPGIRPDGNCWIKTVMDQINNRFVFVINTLYILKHFSRKTFENKISQNVQENRLTFASICESAFRKSSLDNGHSDSDWKEGWNKMKENGRYLVDYFADLFVIGEYQLAWPSPACQLKSNKSKRLLLH